jgi:hypothetical protein
VKGRAFFLVVLIGLYANAAFACPVCGTTKEEARLAFILMTGFLTLMPLALIGGFIYWLVKRARAMDAAHEAAQRSLAS